MLTNRQLFQSHLAKTSEFPLMVEIERAEGVWMYGPDNKKYLDLISGIAVSNLGHCHPAVVEAVRKQVGEYMHLLVYGEFIQSPQVKLAKALADTLPEELSVVYLVNSGTEATEGAMKLAKRYTGRSKIVSCFDAYHGSTNGSLSLMGNETFKQNYRPLLPGISHIEFGNFDHFEEYITEETAAFFVETVRGESGVIEGSMDYWKAVRKRCTETGTLLVLDEIQAGMGRTGKFWAFEHYGITPDILLSAKGLGGGMPIGAFISSQEIMSSLSENPILGHITTFGGHPVSAAAALATVNTLRETKIYEQAEMKAQRFKDNLKGVKKIREIRSAGLMMAIEFDSFEQLKSIIDKAIEYGVMTDWFLFNDRSMRVAPPLVISDDEIDWACEQLEKAINEAG
ncbi:aspartate aminotransferase family protein [Marinigracilibium pacificum]|uniref:Aspartate aminotransferase family protein n=1 Tax=Marinigracilibium pacificum TaxID=2729599 RepID=A0A848J8D5_9BACT|nr:aspartate aminotransferase family protein [Marinigracilibium pacificum]NMM50639.1 aspartate aminotransferase family protein [Marinigracilibium pacificum]